MIIVFGISYHRNSFQGVQVTYTDIGIDYGLAPNMWQATYMRYSASMGQEAAICILEQVAMARQRWSLGK